MFSWYFAYALLRENILKILADFWCVLPTLIKKKKIQGGNNGKNRIKFQN